MSAITHHAPECERCGGTVKLEVRFRASGTDLHARCTGECKRAGWVVGPGES